LAGLITFLGTALNPEKMFEDVKDENLKRRYENLGAGFLLSQYVTLLYSLGKNLAGRFFFGVLSPVCKDMAASAYVMLRDQNVEKVMLLAVPKELSTNTALLESIEYSSNGEKGKTAT
jgi:hypothetical protein